VWGAVFPIASSLCSRLIAKALIGVRLWASVEGVGAGGAVGPPEVGLESVRAFLVNCLAPPIDSGSLLAGRWSFFLEVPGEAQSKGCF